MALSISNLLVGVGVAFDAQLKAADNLFFAAGVDFDDPTRPMFGGSVGDVNGFAQRLTANALGAGAPGAYNPGSRGFESANNGIDGDPVTVRQVSTADGPIFQLVDAQGKEITVDDASTNGYYSATKRYVVKSDGIIYDCLVHQGADGSGDWKVADPNAVLGGTGIAAPLTITNDSGVGNSHYVRPVGRITFKAKEGATLARAQDEMSRMGSVVQLLSRLLESIQDESKGFSSIIR